MILRVFCFVSGFVLCNVVVVVTGFLAAIPIPRQLEVERLTPAARASLNQQPERTSSSTSTNRKGKHHEHLESGSRHRMV